MEHVEFFKGVFVPYFNFFVFIGLAIYFFRKPFHDIAAKRAKDYQNAVEGAATAKAAAEARHQELQARLQGLDQEVRDIRENTRRDAELEAERMIEASKQLSKTIVEEARRVAATERERAKAELRQEVLSSALNRVTKEINDRLDPQRKRAVFERSVTEMQKLRAGVN